MVIRSSNKKVANELQWNEQMIRIPQEQSNHSLQLGKVKKTYKKDWKSIQKLSVDFPPNWTHSWTY